MKNSTEIWSDVVIEKLRQVGEELSRLKLVVEGCRAQDLSQRSMRPRRPIRGNTKERVILSGEQRNEVVRIWKEGVYSQKEIAVLFNVSESTVCRILDAARPGRS